MYRLDERFLDRPGCGDELYLDARFKAATCLAELHDSDGDLHSDLDTDLAGGADEFANH
jgi:hypothetical protein